MVIWTVCVLPVVDDVPACADACPMPASTKAPRAERRRRIRARSGDRHWLGIRVIRMMKAPGNAPVGVGSAGPRTVAGAFSCPTHPLSGVRIPDERTSNTPGVENRRIRRTRTRCVVTSADGSRSLRETLQPAADHPPVPVVGKGVAGGQRELEVAPRRGAFAELA